MKCTDMISRHEIDRIINRIVEVYQPEKVILFGSYAGGNVREDSDLDLFLIKQTNEEPVARAAGIRKELRDFFVPMDILIFTPDEIERDKDRKYTFIHNVLKSGRIVYAGQ
jgi:predicted nucleotidyltransferase